MAAALQNYTIEQGQTLQSQLTVQVAGVPISINGDLSIGSTTVNNVALASSLAIGNSLTGTGIQANTIITNIASTTLTISNPATVTMLQQPLVAGAYVAVNLTGVIFLFTADVTKPAVVGGPTIISFNWTEVSTPVQGQTWLTLADTVTQTMLVTNPPPAQPNQYYYQIWVENAPGLPALCPLLEGIIIVTQPVSNRNV